MKKVTLLGFICLAVILTAVSFAACAEQAAAPTATVTAPAVTVTVTATAPAKAPTYTVMDPRAVMAPIPYVGLSPRLTTLVGKKIGVINFMGGNYHALEPVAAALNKAVPGCKAEYYAAADRMAPAYMAFVKTCDGVILGNNY